MTIKDLHNSTMMEKNVTISCRVPLTIKEEIQRYAKQGNRSTSNLTTILVKLGLQEYTKDIPEDILWK